MIDKNLDIFGKDNFDLGKTDLTMKIDTYDHPLIKLRHSRTPLNKMKIVEGAVEEMLDAGIIEMSHSPWSFSIVMVAKSDGTPRFCIDFRALNKISKIKACPFL